MPEFNNAQKFCLSLCQGPVTFTVRKSDGKYHVYSLELECHVTLPVDNALTSIETWHGVATGLPMEDDYEGNLKRLSDAIRACN